MREIKRTLLAALLNSLTLTLAWAQEDKPTRPPHDAVAQAQTQRAAAIERPEQGKTKHDRSDIFDAPQAQPSSPVFEGQPKEGKISGFDFYRDPLNADQPNQDPAEIMKKEIANKPKVMAAQRELLEQRYSLIPRLDPESKMSRGKPLAVGPTARLPEGISWERLGGSSPEEIKQQGIFPYPSLPHPLQSNGGQVFPDMQIDMFPRLARFDVEFDLPEAFLPEFPPAIFLQNRPELGDVSRGDTKVSCGASASSSIKASAPAAIRHRSTSTTRCMICTSSAS